MNILDEMVDERQHGHKLPLREPQLVVHKQHTIERYDDAPIGRLWRILFIADSCYNSTIHEMQVIHDRLQSKLGQAPTIHVVDSPERIGLHVDTQTYNIIHIATRGPLCQGNLVLSDRKNVQRELSVRSLNHLIEKEASERRLSYVVLTGPDVGELGDRLERHANIAYWKTAGPEVNERKTYDLMNDEQRAELDEAIFSWVDRFYNSLEFSFRLPNPDLIPQVLEHRLGYQVEFKARK